MTAIKLHRSGMDDCQAGNLDAAADKLKLALEEVQEMGLKCYQVKIQNNLGVVFEMKGNRRKARDHYRAAYEMARSRIGDGAKLVALLGTNLARVSC